MDIHSFLLFINPVRLSAFFLCCPVYLLLVPLPFSRILLFLPRFSLSHFCLPYCASPHLFASLYYTFYRFFYYSLSSSSLCYILVISARFLLITTNIACFIFVSNFPTSVSSYSSTLSFSCILFPFGLSPVCELFPRPKESFYNRFIPSVHYLTSLFEYCITFRQAKITFPPPPP